VIAFLVAQASGQMEGFAVGRIEGEDLLVPQLGGIELARLVMPDRALQDLFKIVWHRGILRKRSIYLNWQLFRNEAPPAAYPAVFLYRCRGATHWYG